MQRKFLFLAPADGEASPQGGAAPAVDRGDDVPPSPAPTPAPAPEPVVDKLDPPEDAETPEEAAEREAAEAAEAAKTRIRIPKARFDEVIAKARSREQELLEEITQLRGGQTAAAAQLATKEMRAEISKLQDTYEDLILDGQKEEARKVRNRADALRDELLEYQSSEKANAARSAAVEEMSFRAQLTSYETRFSTINPEHVDYDAQVTEEVATLLRAFVASGTSRSDALAKAVRYVVNPAAAAQPAKPPAVATTADQRTIDARKKAADAAKRQPADLTVTGIDSDKAGGGAPKGVDVMKMDQRRFAKLDSDTLSSMRGDVLGK